MISFSQAEFKVSDQLKVSINELTLKAHDLIVLLGQNGSGKSVLARALAGKLPLVAGSITCCNDSSFVHADNQEPLVISAPAAPDDDGSVTGSVALAALTGGDDKSAAAAAAASATAEGVAAGADAAARTSWCGYRAELVSFEGQQALFEADYNMRNSDTTSSREEGGLLGEDLLKGLDVKSVNEAIVALGIAPLLKRQIRTMSGGEGRKLLLARALGARPDLLVLDTPFDALDIESRKNLLEIIAYVHQNYEQPVVLIVNRPDEIPEELTALGIIADLSLVKLSSREDIEQDDEARALLYCGNLPQVALPEPPARYVLPEVPGPVVSLKKVNITYDRPVLKDLDFTVEPGEHWQITGPNGAGKSTLLSLITGDNPLVYTNDVTVFGFKRGSGESIWDIKKRFGYVSGALHLDYRVSAPVINVVLSGFYDSIGLYNRPDDTELKVARAWLKLAGLEHMEQQSFKALSFGRQRLLLIIRALVKNPPLLILDEPLQGLDSYGRALVRSFITYIMEHGKTSVLFVSHHEEDAPAGINRRLSFVRNASGDGFTVVQERLD